MAYPVPGDLDDLLGAWALTQRLTEDQADGIRRAITDDSPALAATWWRDFNARMSAAVIQATATPASAVAALRATASLPVAMRLPAATV